MMSKLALVGITLMTLSLTTSAEAVSFRCGVFSFLGNDRACRASCWVTGQTSGHCDYNGNCMCSEKDLDLGQSVRELLGGLDVLEYVQLKFDSFIDEVDSWQISEKVKSLIPTRCQLGDDFCDSSCHGIGRVSGKCNLDYTDCECSNEKVDAKQYALCVDEGVCSLYCQRRGYASGGCQGRTGWDCNCITKMGSELAAPLDF